MAHLTSDKNNDRSSFNHHLIEEEIHLFTFKNDSEHSQDFYRDTDPQFIQFHFCIKGEATFIFNEGRYQYPIHDEKSMILYNTQQHLPIHLRAVPHSWVISVLISIKKLHSLFSSEAGYISFLTDENKDKKYYQENPITPSMAVVLNQILNFNLHDSVRRTYLKGKVYELIGLYFNRPAEADVETCPFLLDEENVRKIRQAKEIILQQLTEPPTLQELADTIGLSLKKLKEGFKEIYGDTVYGFLLDYKLEYARQLLENGSYNVTEVGLKVGYSTSSHFIAAFKKKFGVTPKKYLLGLVQG